MISPVVTGRRNQESCDGWPGHQSAPLGSLARYVDEHVTKDTVPVDKNDTILMPVAE